MNVLPLDLVAVSESPPGTDRVLLGHHQFAVSDPPLVTGNGLSILCLTDGPGATWRLSFELPLRRLREAGSVRLVCLDERGFDRFDLRQARTDFSTLLALLMPDIVILSRCGTTAATVLIDVAADRGLPIVYHLDDDLFAVPKELGKSKFDYYHSPARQAALRLCCERSDLIYCSTEALSLRLGRFGFNTPITYGRIYCAASEPFADFAPKRPVTIGYMGTAGHKADLDELAEAISAILANYPELRFETMGTVAAPERLKATFPRRVDHVPAVADYDQFLARLKQLGWAVALAPLRATGFNAVKANTKFVEYTVAGLPIVVSRGRVYAEVIRDDAVLAASSIVEWITAIDRLLSNPTEAAAQVKRAQAKLQKDYLMSGLETQLLSVLTRAIEARSSS